MGERIRLSGAPETLLATLYAKALDNRREKPVLGDSTADELVRRIDYDFAKIRLTPADLMTVTLRAKLLDTWVSRHLAEQQDAQVLHLGCGLDTRSQRLALPAATHWYDVDQPDVIDLRARLLPHDQRTIATSVTDLRWLEQVPPGRPTLVVAEGLSMYLPDRAGPALLRALVAHCGHGEMMFDAVLPWTVRLANMSGFLRDTGARFSWAIDDPRELESLVPGLHLVAERSVLDIPELARLPLAFRLTARLLNTTRVLGMSIRSLHYRFHSENHRMARGKS